MTTAKQMFRVVLFVVALACASSAWAVEPLYRWTFNGTWNGAVRSWTWYSSSVAMSEGARVCADLAVMVTSIGVVNYGGAVYSSNNCRLYFTLTTAGYFYPTMAGFSGYYAPDGGSYNPATGAAYCPSGYVIVNDVCTDSGYILPEPVALTAGQAAALDWLVGNLAAVQTVAAAGPSSGGTGGSAPDADPDWEIFGAIWALFFVTTVTVWYVSMGVGVLVRAAKTA